MIQQGNNEWNGVPMPRRIGAIIAVAFGVALSVIDGTIANVALPTIARHLTISEADSIWIVNAYQLAVMVSILTFSNLGDVIGHRKIYLSGLLLFTVASVGCALADSYATLVAARAAQGLGSAAVVSVNTTLIRIIYPKTHLGRGLGVNATVVAISSVAGPSLAAAILSVAEWPWLFAINIPIGFVAIALSYRFLPQNPARIAGRKFRWQDGVMSALTFGLMMLSVEGFSHGVDLRWIAAGVAAFAVVGYRFVKTQLTRDFPILPFDLLRIPIFSLSVLTSVSSYLAQMLAMVALPFYLQHECGYDDVRTGLLMTAWPAIVMLIAPLAGLMVERIHAGLLGGTGLVLMSAGMLLLALLPEGAAAADIIWRMMLCGAGFALFQSPNNSVLIASAPTARSGSASGMLATARLTGQTTGAALMALLFHAMPDNSTHAALFIAAAIAALAAAISFSRLRLPLPEALRRR